MQFCACPGDDGLATVNCGATCSNGRTAGTYVSVYTSTTYNALVGYPGLGGSFPLRAQATVRVQ